MHFKVYRLPSSRWFRYFATRIAHTLSDSTIPVSEIRYDLVDFIVMSLREMPEYKHHVSHHWNAMLRCVLHGDEHISRKNSGAKKSDNRINIVTQRVMIRMLVAAVQFEVMNIGQHSKGKDKVVPMNLIDDGDSEFLEAQRSALTTSFQSAAASTTAKSATSKNVATSNNAKAQEDLTMALLRELPQLLVSFKSDTSIVKSLTTLPLYFRMSTCFSFFVDIVGVRTLSNMVQSIISLLSSYLKQYQVFSICQAGRRTSRHYYRICQLYITIRRTLLYLQIVAKPLYFVQRLVMLAVTWRFLRSRNFGMTRCHD